MIELRHLRYFRAVAEELHFGRAAKRVHVAQPALSQQVRQLERELGVILLIRSTRKVDLTDAGRAYMKRAIAILDGVDDAAEHARRIALGTAGHVVIGCVGSATYSLLPRFVRALRERVPDVDVSVHGEMLAPAQLDALLAGEIDLALLRPPVELPGITCEVVRRDRLIAALPQEHPLAANDELAVSDLNGQDFIAHAGHGRSVMSSVVTAVCGDAGFTPRVRHEVEETSTLVTLVAAGLGVAIVPEPTKELDIAGVCYRRLHPHSLGINLVAAKAADNDSPVISQALQVLRAVTNRSDHDPSFARRRHDTPAQVVCRGDGRAPD
jgi:DNA-binding transcriptional LysR family regulator